MSASCTGCGRANRLGARFCGGCGRGLTSPCPSCGRSGEPGEQFCTECGHALGATSLQVAPAKPGPDGERKQVTVLFADVVRSMELAERLGPDELTEVMQGLFEVCRQAVAAYGGTVDKFTGDGMMALFGAPVAFEDHARRACHAALALLAGAARYAAGLRAREVELVVRVGLNSGEVVAGSVGEAFTAVGHSVGLAQRMESAALPGTVCLSEHTAALVEAEFRLRDLGPTTVKGSSLPLRVFALDAALGGSSAAGRRRAGSARLVGREEEFATLETALLGAMDGRAQVVGIVGEAGAGKSRLCEELARRADELGVTVRRTAGVSHAQSVPLLPILGFLRDYFGVVESDTPAQIRAKVSDRLLGLDQGLRSELGLIFDFLEVADPALPAPQLGPEARQRRVLDVFRRTTARRSERAALLLVFEDLHWFDSASLAFLEAWLPSFPGSRTLIVLNFRPEFRAPWRHSYYRQLPLAPLDPDAVLRLLDELLGADASLEALTANLRSRTGGNPFFIEEIVRSLAADGTLVGAPGAYLLAREAAEVRVPATVQAVLAGRIDHLDAGTKAVLQAAAVIGRTFSEQVLRTVAGVEETALTTALRALCAEEFLHETGLDNEYRFWHPLTQEVAYGTLLTSDRRRRHVDVAQALIGLGRERHDELAALIATHFEAAGDDLEAARWQINATRRAMGGDVAEAFTRLRSALDHLALLPATRTTVELATRARCQLLRVGGRTGMEPGEAARIHAEGRAAAEEQKEPGLLAMLNWSDGVFSLFAGNTAEAQASMGEGMRWADQSGDLGLRAWMHCTGAIGYFLVGPLDEGLRRLEHGAALTGGDPAVGREHAGYSPLDTGEWIRAGLYIPMGRLAEARSQLAAARAAYAVRPVPEWRLWALSFLAPLAECTGDPPDSAAARAALDEVLGLAEDTGTTVARVKALLTAGTVGLLDERPEEARTLLTEAISTLRERRSGLLDEASALIQLARAHLALGDAEAARRTADEAVAVGRHRGAQVVECLAHAVRARVYRETATGSPDLAEAREAVEAGEGLAAAIGAATYRAFLAEERARLDGDLSSLKACADRYDAIGATGHARRLQIEIAGI